MCRRAGPTARLCTFQGGWRLASFLLSDLINGGARQLGEKDPSEAFPFLSRRRGRVTGVFLPLHPGPPLAFSHGIVVPQVQGQLTEGQDRKALDFCGGTPESSALPGPRQCLAPCVGAGRQRGRWQRHFLDQLLGAPGPPLAAPPRALALPMLPASQPGSSLLPGNCPSGSLNLCEGALPSRHQRVLSSLSLISSCRGCSGSGRTSACPPQLGIG